MKNTYFSPYANLSLNPIKAPNREKREPKSTVSRPSREGGSKSKKKG